MSSGVTAANDVITMYEEMKLRRKFAYIVYKIDGASIVPADSLTTEDAEKLGSEATYEKFVSQFPAGEGRYGVYDFEFETPDGVRNKLVFFLWAPDTAAIKSKMIYASSKQAIRQRLEGIHTEIQCTDASELAYESAFEKIAGKGAKPLLKAPKA
ncbi:actin depolymerizing protein [Rhizoclosmatium globosum]|uniref:Cofilin n=1 Tax=Rhizoclosmatium globosum TaxID=329046 RepID=A0A1Y2CD46_9FUNG|nr:actin depolymerizing protein [Rhizoclosmatium globosum]|eukprot:ORY44827.1 actin depolymerizing protein [Rhizoclosmatium globosum]